MGVYCMTSYRVIWDLLWFEFFSKKVKSTNKLMKAI
jgi:hypothetical protein